MSHHHLVWAEVDLDQEIGIWKLNKCSRMPSPAAASDKKGLHEKIIDVIKSK